MKLENIFNASIRKESFYIPREMVITGSVNTEMPGQVAGVINGNLFAKNKVVILKEAVVNGDITAEELLVYGRINGDVVCSGKMIIQNGAVIKGNIVTAEIHIEKDTVIEGVITKSQKQTEEPDDEPGTGYERNDLSGERFEKIVTAKKEDSKRQAWF